jgi:hypothetical protein
VTTPTAAATTTIELADDWEAVNDHFLAEGWSDGLPIVPPTHARVRRFVEASRREPAAVVAVLPPAMGIATVEKVAVNAVMAGCRPEYMPLLCTALEAVSDPAFNGHTIQVSSNPVGVLVVVNGPIRRTLDIAVGANCMGNGARANTTIGRAVRLLLVNVGGSVVGTIDKACHGFPGKISFCFGENEEASPWPPLHAERGFARDDSTVTVVGAQGTSNILVHGNQTAADLLPTLAHGMINAGANNFALGPGEPMLVLNPGHAQALAADGVDRAALREYVFLHARVPIDWYPPRAQEASFMAERTIDGRVPITDRPERIMVVVAGAPGSHSTFIPTFAETTAVTRRIEVAAVP